MVRRRDAAKGERCSAAVPRTATAGPMDAPPVNAFGENAAMDLISYAQNQEDVMLWRALKHVKDGFYIDVGAADPVDLSITHFFSMRGWSGINIEPNVAYFEKLKAQRPRDINLAVCATSESGEQVFYRIPGTGLSTLNESVADLHRQNGLEVEPLRVPCRTLAEICAEHRPDGPIHFLKIDVEGGEAGVLGGADFARFRPWIVVVEATKPLSQEVEDIDWETVLLENDYRFVWFDGLNRFYVAGEHAPTLQPHFTVPPNIFDGFARAADLLGRAEAADQYAANEKAARERADAARLAAEAANRAVAMALEDATRRGREADLRIQQAEKRAAIMRAEHASALGALLERAAASAEAAGVRLDAALRRASEMEAAQAQMQIRMEAAQVQAAGRLEAEALVHAYRNSTSWRLTRPLRGLAYILRRQLRVRDVFLYAFRNVPLRLRLEAPHAAASHKPAPSGTAPETGSAMPCGAGAAWTAKHALTPRGRQIRQILLSRAERPTGASHPV